MSFRMTQREEPYMSSLAEPLDSEDQGKVYLYNTPAHFLYIAFGMLEVVNLEVENYK